MGLTPAPVNAWFLAWVAIAPLWVLLFSVRQSLKSNILLALAWGIGYHGLALSWIRGLHPLTWMGVPWLGSIAIALFAWVAITLWGAILVICWAFLLTKLTPSSPHSPIPTREALRRNPQSSIPDPQSPIPSLLRVFIGTALWCILETLWSYGALYWTSVSYTQSPSNLAILHLGQLSGAMTVTAAIVAFNGVLAEAWMQFNGQGSKPDGKKLLGLGLALFVTLHLTGFWLYRQPLAEPTETALQVGIVQGNIPTRIKLFEEGLRRSLQAYIQGYETLAGQGVDVVITPEGALPWIWVGTPQQSQNPLYQAIRSRGIPAWVGTVGTQNGRITQSLFTIMGTGEIYSRFNKIKLVPLGEYIPFESILGSLINRLSPVEASMIPGSLNQHFDTPFGRAIAAICYESAFPKIFRDQAAAGGQFILTASNNDPYNAAMMAQHHAQDTMRAIETDRWAVRATNTGFSGIVDPHGRTQWISGFRTYETHAHTIYRRQTKTLYVRVGDWLTPLSGIGAIGCWIVWRWQRSSLF